MNNNVVRYCCDVEKLQKFLDMHFRTQGLPNSLNALEYAKEKYQGILRKGDGHPYIIHPMRMARLAISMGIKNDRLFAIILLHDVLEETPTTRDDLPFSEDIRFGVETLTFSVNPRETRDEAKVRYYEKISRSRDAILCKALDRFDNMSTMSGCLLDQQIKKNIVETDQLLLPMLHGAEICFSSIAEHIYLLETMIRALNENLAIAYNVELNRETRFGGKPCYINPYQ